ncbi:MAG: trigger factor [Treponema sp.]|nr:trigger factor [Treponema sp.]
MSVTKEITRLEKSNVKINLTIPKEDVQSQYHDLIKDYAKNIQLPGFRKGKVPQDVLERKFGEALKGEALGKIVEKAVGEVFDDENLPRDERPLPYSQPQLQEEDLKLDFDKDLSFSLIYDVLPKVTVGQWKGLEVEVPDAAVTEEDLTRELEEVRERNSFVLDRDDNAEAQTGDVVTITHCELDENGGVVPDTTREDFTFTLGNVQNTTMFDDDIIGMKKGETREFTKTKKMRVTLKELKEKKLPDLDDDLAQDVDEKFQTLDDLKNNIRERLEQNLKQRLEEIKINNILEKIMENTPVVLPESMVRVELDGRLRNLARRFGVDTAKLMQLLAHDGQGLEDIQGQWRPSAEKALHSRLILENLMEEQQIEASDEDIGKEMEAIAASSGESLEETEQRYGEGNALEYIKEEIKERRMFAMLIAENTIKTGSRMNYLDVVEKNR